MVRCPRNRVNSTGGFTATGDPRNCRGTLTTATVYRVTFDRDKLLRVPQPERTLFFSLGHIANEINALRKLVLWSSDFSSELDALTKAQVTLSLMFIRLLAGKVKEAHIVLQRHYFPGDLSTQYASPLPEDATAALDALKKYFGRTNKADLVRTHYAFHYSPAKLDAELSSVPDRLELFVSQHHGNSLYYASEVLVSRAILTAIGPGEDQDLFGQLVGDIMRISQRSVVFAAGFMAAFIGRHKDIWAGKGERLDLLAVPRLTDIKLPWFVFEEGTSTS